MKAIPYLDEKKRHKKVIFQKKYIAKDIQHISNDNGYKNIHSNVPFISPSRRLQKAISFISERFLQNLFT